ncbi:hypothetical protein DOS83_01785 [Staphylococcus felis]|uniref:Uncharacterized protein n=1 Tax=Staphylococcus felis TaxID=46127 RepID=A0A3E0ISA1_9STAP|nr:hypothetical protein DOS61_05415 [Staphylococcus felis]REH99803.1 hypothetical protein DOS83_01785 [Staphylococcus felis]
MGKLFGIDLKNNLLILYIVCFIIVIFSMFLNGISNLNHNRSVQYLELFFSIIGIILFPSLFSIEKKHVIIELINTKRFDYKYIFLFRIISTFIVTFIFSVFTYMMLTIFNSQVKLSDIYIAFTSTIFVGSICLLITVLSNNLLNGYMFGLVYFLVCLGFRNLSFIFLFPETFNFPYYFKVVQLLLSIIILASVVILSDKFKREGNNHRL